MSDRKRHAYRQHDDAAGMQFSRKAGCADAEKMDKGSKQSAASFGLGCICKVSAAVKAGQDPA